MILIFKHATVARVQPSFAWLDSCHSCYKQKTSRKLLTTGSVASWVVAQFPEVFLRSCLNPTHPETHLWVLRTHDVFRMWVGFKHLLAWQTLGLGLERLALALTSLNPILGLAMWMWGSYEPDWGLLGLRPDSPQSGSYDPHIHCESNIALTT